MNRLVQLLAAARHELRVLWRAARDPRRPAWLRPALALVVVYLVSPVDLIPEALPLIGVVDDLVLIPLALAWLVRALPAGLRRELEAQLAREGRAA